MLPAAPGVAGRERRDRDSRPRGGGGDCAVVEARHNGRDRLGDQMHAAGVVGTLQPGRQMPLDAGQQSVLAGGVEQARAPQMGREMAVGDEVGQRALSQQGGAGRHRFHALLGGGDEGGGQHDVAQPQRGEEQFGEAREIGDTAAAIQRAQRGQRPAGVAVLAVEIVLGDPAFVALGPAQQLEPALQAEHRAQRELMGGRHDRELRLGCDGKGAVDGETALVDRHRHGAHVGERQRLARADEARLLDPGGIVGIEHQPGQQRQALAHTGGDHDRVRSAGEATGGAEIGGDGGTQSGMAERMQRAGD